MVDIVDVYEEICTSPLGLVCTLIAIVIVIIYDSNTCQLRALADDIWATAVPLAAVSHKY